MLRQNVYLIGMPGSGKTTLGRNLATLVALPFVDLDKQIEKAENKTVSEIFSSSGEDYFRNAEANILRQVTEFSGPLILSTGGGTPCFHGNMELMLNSGFTIFLDPPLEVIERRLAKTQNRPLLQSDPELSLLEKLKHLREKRLSFYTQALLRISDDDITAERLIQLIP